MTKDDRLPAEFYIMIFASTAIFLSVESTRPILPLHITSVGATTLELGFIIGLVSFGLMIVKIPIGIISETIPVKRILVVSSLGQSIVQGSYALAHSPEAFYPIQIIHAISIAPLVPVAFAVSHNLAPDGRRGVTIGMYLTSYGIAATAGSFLCSLLSIKLTYVQIFQVAAIIPLIGLIPMILARNDGCLSAPTGGDNRHSIGASMNHILKSRNVLLLSFLRLSYAVTYAFFITLFVIHAETSLLLPVALIAFLFGSRNATDMVLRIPVGRLLDKSDYRKFITLAFGSLAAIYYLVSEVHDFFILTFIMILFGCAIGLRVVAEYTMLGEYSEPGARSIAAAYLSTMFNIGSGFGAVLAGILSAFMDIPSIFKIASALMLSAMIVSLAIRKDY